MCIRDRQGGDLRVDLFVDNVQVLDTTFRVDQGRTPQEVADRLRDHIEGQLTGAPTGGASIPEDLRDALQDGLSVEVVGAAGTDDLALVLQLPASVGDLRTDIDFESSLNAQSGTLSVTSFEIPQDLSAGDTIELTFTVNDNTAPGGTPATVTLTADFDPDANGQTLDAFARAVAEQVSNAQHPDTSLADRALGLSADIVTLTADPASGAAGAAGALGIQISAPQGANLGAVQLLSLIHI